MCIHVALVEYIRRHIGDQSMLLGSISSFFLEQHLTLFIQQIEYNWSKQNSNDKSTTEVLEKLKVPKKKEKSFNRTSLTTSSAS